MGVSQTNPKSVDEGLTIFSEIIGEQQQNVHFSRASADVNGVGLEMKLLACGQIYFNQQTQLLEKLIDATKSNEVNKPVLRKMSDAITVAK